MKQTLRRFSKPKRKDVGEEIDPYCFKTTIKLIHLFNGSRTKTNSMNQVMKMNTEIMIKMVLRLTAIVRKFSHEIRG